MGGTVVDGGNGTIITPLAIIGQTRKGSGFLNGDSMFEGFGDTFDASSDTGHGERGVGGTLAYINAGSYNDNTTAFIASSAGRRGLCDNSHVIVEYGSNDIAGGTALAALQANLIQIWGYYLGKSVYQTTIPPRTTSNVR